MTTDVSSVTMPPKGLRYGLGFAVLWVVLALISPETTYHLAPLIVAGAPAIVDALERAGPLARYAVLSVLGLAFALIATGILSVMGNLAGPSLLPFGGAALESVAVAIAGALLGLVGAAWISRR